MASVLGYKPGNLCVHALERHDYQTCERSARLAAGQEAILLSIVQDYPSLGQPMHAGIACMRRGFDRQAASSLSRKDHHHPCHTRMHLAGIHYSLPWDLNAGFPLGMTKIIVISTGVPVCPG